MASIVEICNMAIGLVSGNRIDDIESTDQEEAILCKERYDTLRKAVLEEAEWSFAIRRASISPDPVEPDFGYSHRFSLPVACLRVCQVTVDPDFRYDTDWKREGQFLLADADAVYVRYISDIQDTSQFSHQFTHALVTKLAADLSLPLTHSGKLRDKYMEEYQEALASAVNKDAMQGKRTKLYTSSLINVRR